MTMLNYIIKNLVPNTTKINIINEYSFFNYKIDCLSRHTFFSIISTLLILLDN